jgi:hypothetical protein
MISRSGIVLYAGPAARLRSEQPRLQIIQDAIPSVDLDQPAMQEDACLRATNEPAAQAAMLYRQIQYLVDEDDWAQQGEGVLQNWNEI